MSSFDIKACVEELQKLIGGKVEKIYHYPPNEIRIRIYAGKKYDLIIEAGRRIHLTRFPKQSPRFPTPFAMLLRKHLEGARIKSIKQHDFDRVVILEFERSDGVKKIIAELFRKGNIILSNDRVMTLRPIHGEYELPKPKELKLEELKNSEREVVKALAMSGLGGLYAEEICYRAGIEKKKKCSELSEEEWKKIEKAIEEIMNFKKKPQIIAKDGEYIDVVPMDLVRYAEYDKRYFESFNEALDDYYSKMISVSEELEELKNEELEKLKKRLELQEETKRKYDEEAEKYRKIGDAIYENYQVIEKILKVFRDARERLGWDEIKRRIKSDEKLRKLVKRVDPARNTITVFVKGVEMELDIGKSIHENADVYYKKAKKAKEKAEGVRIAIEKTKEEMRRAEELAEKKLVSRMRVRRKREWYEEYRWFFTSDGFLAIGGRTAEMNEEIVSKHMESKDLFFHTQTPGAPVVILKKGQEAPESSIKEVAEFAATYSSLWKEGKYSGEVYYVKPDQVSRAARAGEYLPKGSFYITGKRNYLTVELNCAIGVELEKFRVIGGPVSAVKRHADHYIELEIGNKEPGELSIEIAKKLIEMSGEEKHIVRAIATPDEIMKFIPPGKSKLK